MFLIWLRYLATFCSKQNKFTYKNIEEIIVYCMQKKWQAAWYHDFNSIIFAAYNEQLFQ